jgi:hypothetical protein
MSDGDETVVYQLRVILEGISPLIWRRLLVPGEHQPTDLKDCGVKSYGTFPPVCGNLPNFDLLRARVVCGS